MKKNLLFLFVFTICSLMIFSQEKGSVLNTPDNWLKEIIPFPMKFAPEIDFVGFEDLRFAPGWSDSTSQEFWTYSFAWYIENDSPLTEKKLTESFNRYYDGLVDVDSTNQADTGNLHHLDKTLSLFVQTKDGFTGKMRLYDAFFTNDYIILNIKVKEYFCHKTNMQIILCYLSPKSFEHRVWNIFDDVKINIKCD